MELSDNAKPELRKLTQRGNALLRTGRRLLGGGAALALISAVSWLIAGWSVPRTDEFTLDVPKALVDVAEKLQGGGLAQFDLQLQLWMGVLFSVAAVGAVAQGMLMAIGSLVERLSESGKTSAKIAHIFLFLLALAGIPYVSYLSWNPIKLEVTSYIRQNSLEDLNQKDVPPEIKHSWRYKYYLAQQAILSGHAEKSQLQDVLKSYETGKLHYQIPAPVRYALEMQAFQRPASDETRRFLADQELKKNRWHRVALISASGAVLLFVAGACISLTGRSVRSRVRFLKAIQ